MAKTRERTREATAASDLVGRPAEGLEDLLAAGELLTRTWLADPTRVTWTPGDLSWWFAQSWPAEIGQHLRLWERDGRVVAWSWHEVDDAEGAAELDFHASSTDPWLDAGIGRRILEDSLGAGPLEVWTADRDTERIGLLETHGFVRLEVGMPGATGHLLGTQYRRAVDAHIAESPIPDGYRIRSMTGPVDIQRRVDVHRAAFAPSRMSVQKYERLVSLPLYRFEDDLVVQAPDGQFAAFTMAWWDQAARIGEFEPVGTHPDHQRRGLGKALLSHALRRYRDLGARSVQVYSSLDNVASEALYQSVGFERDALYLRYRRPAS
jgi:ribosomal protein S18 acetylase RimI-like enzyme